MTLMLSDPAVATVPVRDTDDPPVVLDPGFGSGNRCWASATGAGAALYGPVLR